MKISAIGASVAVVVASVASADVTYTFTNKTWTAFNFTEAYAAGSLTGTLTGVSVNATLNASANYTYADDLCVYMDAAPLGTGGLLQVGGYSNLSALQRYSWPNGGSSAPGSTVSGTVNLTTPGYINMAANPTQSIWIGNGYGGPGNAGTWTGTITLIGVNVPAPGAVALLGLAGAIGGRRRRA